MGTNHAGDWQFVIVWEFRPKPGTEQRFEEAYGPGGVWAQLFARGAGYLGTELNQDLKDRSRYLTLDFWLTEQHYESFRAAHSPEYAAIDEKCEELTETEREIGKFRRLGG